MGAIYRKVEVLLEFFDILLSGEPRISEGHHPRSPCHCSDYDSLGLALVGTFSTEKPMLKGIRALNTLNIWTSEGEIGGA